MKCPFFINIASASSYYTVGWWNFGRHTLLSRGWRSPDKHCITPMVLQHHRLGLTTQAAGLAIRQHVCRC